MHVSGKEPDHGVMVSVTRGLTTLCTELLLKAMPRKSNSNNVKRRNSAVVVLSKEPKLVAAVKVEVANDKLITVLSMNQ